VEISVERKCYSQNSFAILAHTTAGMQEVERSRMPEPSGFYVTKKIGKMDCCSAFAVGIFSATQTPPNR